jgi:hypothetical protein
MTTSRLTESSAGLVFFSDFHSLGGLIKFLVDVHL